MKIYLDTNIFYQAYLPPEFIDNVEWIFENLGKEFLGLTSEWTIIELARATKKQVNLGVITEGDASLVLNFFIADTAELVKNKKLLFLKVTKQNLISAREFIFKYNLYSADALHLAQVQAKADLFLTFDKHFKRVKEVQVINPKDSNFKKRIRELK